MIEINIETEFVKLDSFLKLASAASTGGEAKIYIKEEMVKVNGEIEIRRGRKLYPSDLVELNDVVYKIV